MASTSSSHQQNAFSGIEPPNKRRKVEESSKLYDVFINHRGPDVKQTLATKLYKSLEQVGVRAFLDSEEKELGTSFPSIIETAICSAKVHIAIFSKGYAHSPWCLAELVLMLQSKAKIIPLFYEVAPWELRYTEKGVYNDAFLGYGKKDRYLDKIKEWKEALQQVSYTAGYEFKSSDYVDCKEIVSAVEKEVQRRKHFHVAKYPVGLHKLVKDFESRCLQDLVQDFESQCGMNRAGEKKANVVGIFGMGGVGKTTLSKELFNQKNSKYTRTSFLFDVREASASGRLPSLQSKLLKDIFGEDHSFVSSGEGTSCLRDRFERSSSSSFLIVLDDIDHVEQLDALIPMDILNKHANNLVIVTTRDVGVLVTAEIDIAYHLKGLDGEDGKELFCWHAFGQPNPCSGYEDLVEKFVNTCGGLPLSLQVLGRHVYNKKDMRYWREELKKVSKTLPGDVMKRLKISFDSLDNEEQQIFMDVACFFINKSKTMAMTIWERSGWCSHHALERLKDKCLLEEFDTSHWTFQYLGSGRDRLALRMHDHLRDLGREMANELSHPPRVWRPQHLKSLELKGFQNILAETKGRCFHSILDESMGCQITYFIGELEDSSDTSLLWLQLDYRNMRPLDLNSVIHPSIPPWIPLQNLQGLRISGGCFQRLWQSDMQAPSHLKELHITRTFLEEFPDLSGKSDNMEDVVLDAKLFPMDIWSLLECLGMNLRSLSVMASDLLGDLASISTVEGATSKSLVIYDFKLPLEEEVILSSGFRTVMSGVENLEIRRHHLVTKILITGNCCQHLQSLKICKVENLIEADLARIKTLNFLEITKCEMLKRLSLTPDLSKLVELNIEECTNLERVSGIAYLTKLTELYISKCPQLEELPCLSKLRCLEKIEIGSCEVLKNITLPTAVIKLSLQSCRDLQRVVVTGDLAKLAELYIKDCRQLEELPSLYTVSCLEDICIESCQKLQNITLPTVLTSLCVKHCRDLQRIVGISDLTKLTRLKIEECRELVELLSLYTVSCLEQIEISSCDKLPNITLPTSFISLSVRNCGDLQRVTVTGDLAKLTKLSITDCPQLEELPSLYTVSCLEDIGIESCQKLQNITLPSTLLKLSLQSCRDLQRVAVTGDLAKLTKLSISDCPQLEELPSPYTLSCLEDIDIEFCQKLQNITLPTRVRKLSVQNFRHLQRVGVSSNLTNLGRLIIKECPELEELPSLSRLSCLEQIVIGTSEKLQCISGIEDLDALYHMELWYCSNALIRNSIYKLKSVPRDLIMIGRAVDGTESTLKQNLFCAANIDVQTYYPDWSELSAVIICYLVVVDRYSPLEDINKSLLWNYDFDSCLDLREGEWIITMVARNRWSYRFCRNIGCVLTEHELLKKWFPVEVKRNDARGRVEALRTVIDSLYCL